MLNNLIKILSFFPDLIALVNRFVINKLASATVPRPHRFSLWTPSQRSTVAATRTPGSLSSWAPQPNPRSQPEGYTSWPSLVDRTFTARHLGPRDPAARSYPDEQLVLDLLKRNGPQTPNPRSTILFCFFAQWFTDSFLRTHPLDPHRNTSNHEIDLCQVYGLDEPSTWALREGTGGLLKTRMKDGWEYPPFLYANGAVDPQFYDPKLEQGLSHLRAGRLDQWQKAIDTSLPGGVVSNPNRRDYMYAFGLDRGGSTIAYSAFTIIFMREHNRIARLLAEANKDWNNDDDRLFETARLINIRQLLTIVVNDYIRHIGGVFPFSLDRTFAEKKPWYRTNRISIEFNLVYRWHSLIPDTFTLAGTPLGHEDYRFNNVLVEQHGVERVISDASSQRAGRIGLFNTPRFMDPAEQHGLKWARDFGVRPFNDYRKRFGMSRYSSIDDFADGPEVAEALKRVYNNNMDEVEFTIGLFAEKRGENETMPDTLRRMVAYDAFTHILTNPVLSTEVHCPDTFSKAGWKLIQENATLEQVIRRNCDETKLTKVSLEI